MTIREFYPQWYDLKSVEVKPSSLARYSEAYNNHITTNAIADVDIDTMKLSIMQSFTNDLIKQDYAKSTVRNLVIFVKSLINTYREINDLPRVTYRVRFPNHNTEERKERSIYNERESAVLTHYALKHIKQRACLGMLITLYTGIRIGETCGLRWSDVDLLRGRLRVQRTIERITINGKSQLLVLTPKTYSSNRWIPLADDLRQILSEIKHDGDTYILSGKDKPCEPSSMRRSFNTICQHAGVTRFNYHTIRHTFATSLLRQNIDVATVASLLGHSNPSTTMSFYAHTDNVRRNLAVNSFTGGMLQR